MKFLLMLLLPSFLFAQPFIEVMVQEDVLRDFYFFQAVREKFESMAESEGASLKFSFFKEDSQIIGRNEEGTPGEHVYETVKDAIKVICITYDMYAQVIGAPNCSSGGETLQKDVEDLLGDFKDISKDILNQSKEYWRAHEEEGLFSEERLMGDIY